MDKKYEPRKEQADILDRAQEHIRSVPYQVTARWLFYRLLQRRYFKAGESLRLNRVNLRLRMQEFDVTLTYHLSNPRSSSST